jgi:putative component of toxin-antitoxin plasmid stabilization module
MIEVRQTEAFLELASETARSQALARIQIRIRRLSLGNFGDVKACR